MLNPSVGLIVLTSSFNNAFTIVVLPELSSPLKINYVNYKTEVINIKERKKTYSIRTLISRSFNFCFLIIVSNPI